MILFSLLGTSNYESVRYCWNERECETHLFGEAILQWFPDTPLYVAVTPEARAHQNFTRLQNVAGARLHPVEIPNGSSEHEMWQIFDAVAQLPRGESVVFDFTHGFRSLPVTALLAVAYARAIKRIEVEHLLYGAYDARDRESNIAPVFDLTPMLQLLEWASAANFFAQSGNAGDLARLMRENQRSPLNDAARAVGALSEGLLLVRPQDVQANASKLLQSLEAAKSHTSPKAFPFRLLAEQLETEFAPFEQSDELEREIAQIEWYLRHKQWIQAVALAREWMVSLTVERNGTTRDEAEKWLFEARTRPEESLSGKMAAAFREIGDFRNDLAHCGKRENPMKPSKIESKSQTLPAQLRQLLEMSRA